MPSLFFFFFFFTAALASQDEPTATNTTIYVAVRQACNATRFPSICEQTLTGSKLPGSNPAPADLVKAAIDATSDPIRSSTSLSQSILALAVNSHNLSIVATRCIEILGYSAYRVGLSSDPDTIRSRIQDVRAWLSSAFGYQSGCWSAYKGINTIKEVGSAIELLGSLTVLTSNALSMAFAFDRFGNDTGLWIPPQTERNGLLGNPDPGRGSGLPARLQRGFEGLVPNVVVCKNGNGGCLGTVQQAVDLAPETGSDLFVIKINQGIYEETVRVPFNKRNVVFLGDGMGKTVITSSMRTGPGLSTYDSATVGVIGDGFMARDITFQNTAGPESVPAVAFRSESDLSLVENCEFLGHQDTLYAHSLRQFYRSCRIQGTVDFIFGRSASVFHDCLILIAPRQVSPEKGEVNVIAAHGRMDPAESTGFVFENCIINGTDEYMNYYYSRPVIHKNYLGRPWREYARTVFLHCYLERIISPEGWLPWVGDFGLSTLYYGEFGNSGPGSNTSGRVPWSSSIPSQNVGMYSLDDFIQGNEWIKAP